MKLVKLNCTRQQFSWLINHNRSRQTQYLIQTNLVNYCKHYFPDFYQENTRKPLANVPILYPLETPGGIKREHWPETG